MKKEDDLSLILLNEKIDLLKSELDENKLYLELSFLALLVIIFGFFKTEIGRAALTSKSPFGYLMLAVVLGLYLGIIYFFYTVIKINTRNKKMINEKISFISKSHKK